MTNDHKHKPFIRHIHVFRGVAVLTIVAVHAWSDQVRLALNSGTSFGVSVLSWITSTLFHDSTLYFSLISGLLCTLVLQSRGWTAFFKSKLAGFISPYIVMTLLFTWYGLNANYELAGFFHGSLGQYVAAVGANLVSGNAMYQLWYMPILAILYVLTPLLAWLMAGERTSWIFWPIMLAPLLVSRVWPDFSWCTPVYFLGAYAVGMFAGARYDEALAVFRRHKNALLVITLLTTAVLLALHAMNVDMIGPVSIRETLWYVQKLASAAVVLVWLQEHEARLPRWMDTVATYSFSIFFLHSILLVFFEKVQIHLENTFHLANNFPLWAVVAAGFAAYVFSITVSVIVSMLAKRAFGRYSRMLLGA